MSSHIPTEDSITKQISNLVPVPANRVIPNDEIPLGEWKPCTLVPPPEPDIKPSLSLKLQAWCKTRLFPLIFVLCARSTKDGLNGFLEEMATGMSIEYAPIFNPKEHKTVVTLLGRLVASVILWPLAVVWNTFVFVLTEIIVRIIWYAIGGPIALAIVVFCLLFLKINQKEYEICLMYIAEKERIKERIKERLK